MSSSQNVGCSSDGTATVRKRDQLRGFFSRGSGRSSQQALNQSSAPLPVRTIPENRTSSTNSIAVSGQSTASLSSGPASSNRVPVANNQPIAPHAPGPSSNASGLQTPGASRRQSPGIWNKAFEALGEEDKETLRHLGCTGPSPDGGVGLVNSLAELCKDKHQQCVDNRWKSVLRGKTIVLRNVTDSIIDWLEKFKTIGDVAVNADPLHAGLPWAAVRLLLQVSAV